MAKKRKATRQTAAEKLKAIVPTKGQTLPIPAETLRKALKQASWKKRLLRSTCLALVEITIAPGDIGVEEFFAIKDLSLQNTLFEGDEDDRAWDTIVEGAKCRALHFCSRWETVGRHGANQFSEAVWEERFSPAATERFQVWVDFVIRELASMALDLKKTDGTGRVERRHIDEAAKRLFAYRPKLDDKGDEVERRARDET